MRRYYFFLNVRIDYKNGKSETAKYSFVVTANNDREVAKYVHKWLTDTLFLPNKEIIENVSFNMKQDSSNWSVITLGPDPGVEFGRMLSREVKRDA